MVNQPYREGQEWMKGDLKISGTLLVGEDVLLGLLLAHELTQDVWVLDVVWHRIDHRVVSRLLVRVEIVARVASAHNGISCDNLRLAAISRRELIQVLLVLVLLQESAFSLILCNFLRSECNLIEFLLLPHPAFALLRIATILLIELSIQLVPIGFACIIKPALLCLPPLLTALFLLLNSMLNELVLGTIAFLVKVGGVADYDVLVSGQHLVILRGEAVTFL